MRRSKWTGSLVRGLSKKFIDPQAEFLFVPAIEVEAKAKELGAIPYDIRGL